MEGDSASCAELLALLSSLSGLPLQQGIAVTGALNPFGEVLPIGGVNEKIEGYFRVCQASGLNGTQGVLIPQRNQRHLMLGPAVCEAVAEGRFHIYTARHLGEAAERLMGHPFGASPALTPGAATTSDTSGVSAYPPDSILGRAERTLQAFRLACQRASAPRHGAA